MLAAANGISEVEAGNGKGWMKKGRPGWRWCHPQRAGREGGARGLEVGLGAHAGTTHHLHSHCHHHSSPHPAQAPLVIQASLAPPSHLSPPRSSSAQSRIHGASIGGGAGSHSAQVARQACRHAEPLRSSRQAQLLHHAGRLRRGARWATLRRLARVGEGRRRHWHRRHHRSRPESVGRFGVRGVAREWIVRHGQREVRQRGECESRERYHQPRLRRSGGDQQHSQRLPETVNSSPYEDGWLIKVKLSNKAGLEKLMNAEKYSEFQNAH